jgi:hypothetical protein
MVGAARLFSTRRRERPMVSSSRGSGVEFQASHDQYVV